MEQIPTIPEFFAGKNIFLTGGSGFIGKVLLEKFLRSCPNLDTIYLLLRPKGGKTNKDRIRAITDLPLFDVLRKENPSAFSKIKVISGDVAELNLDISPSDRQTLINNVHIFIHGAASVRFDKCLSDAVILNTRGTREACKLALEMKQIMLFYYISTTYCVAGGRTVIEEKLYPPIADWQKTIRIAEEGDQRIVNVLTKKYMGSAPNTYTFSKNLSEHVVNDMLNKRIPVVITRPSIVLATYDDPIPGWIDNLNGPSGLLVASGKGVLRNAHVKLDAVADYIPVDVVVRGMIASIWNQLVLTPPEERLAVIVFNGAKRDSQPVTFEQILEIGKALSWKYPAEGCVWYPDCVMTSCWYNYYFRFMLYQLLPCMVLDGFIKLAGYEPILMKVQRKIYSATDALSYFVLNQWVFINEKGTALEKKLLPSDLKNFAFNKSDVDVIKFFEDAVIGGRKYILKEDMNNIEHARSHLKRMWIIHIIFNAIWYSLLIWLVFFKFDIVSLVLRKLKLEF